MKKIIGIIKPFELNQSLMVYEDGNKIDVCETTLNDLDKNLFPLMDKHQVYRLDLVGPKKYLKGFSEQVIAKGKAKYNNAKEIEINII